MYKLAPVFFACFVLYLHYAQLVDRHERASQRPRAVRRVAIGTAREFRFGRREDTRIVSSQTLETAPHRPSQKTLSRNTLMARSILSKHQQDVLEKILKLDVKDGNVVVNA